jgi:low temperature requirement protein LtrA
MLKINQFIDWSRTLEPPHLRSTERVERHATWLELFYDLVYVAAITQLSEFLDHHLTLVGYAQFLLLFLPVWWAWTGHTLFADRFDTDDLVHRTFTFVQMFGAILLAVNLKGAFNQSANLFALSYLAIRVILLLLYLRVHIALPEVRPVAALFLIGFGIGQTIWIASLFIPTPAKYFIWIVSLFSEFATPWVGNRMLSQVSVHSTHLPERLGLFTLIVLGELIIAVVSGVSGVLWTTPAAVKAVIAFTSAVLIWVYILISIKNALTIFSWAPGNFISMGISLCISGW